MWERLSAFPDLLVVAELGGREVKIKKRKGKDERKEGEKEERTVCPP